jgi:hypothetical protein
MGSGALGAKLCGAAAGAAGCGFGFRFWLRLKAITSAITTRAMSRGACLDAAARSELIDEAFPGQLWRV